MDLVPVRIGTSWLAFDAACVEQILGTCKWMVVPGAPPEMPGVIAWRGRAVALLDLSVALRVGGPLDERDRRSRALVARVGDSMVAMLVDEVREVHGVSPSDVRPPHAVARDSAVGEIEIAGSVMPVIDLHDLVARSAGRAGTP